MGGGRLPSAPDVVARSNWDAGEECVHQRNGTAGDRPGGLLIGNIELPP